MGFDTKTEETATSQEEEVKEAEADEETKE